MGAREPTLPAGMSLGKEAPSPQLHICKRGLTFNGVPFIHKELQEITMITHGNLLGTVL